MCIGCIGRRSSRRRRIFFRKMGGKHRENWRVALAKPVVSVGKNTVTERFFAMSLFVMFVLW